MKLPKFRSYFHSKFYRDLRTTPNPDAHLTSGRDPGDESRGQLSAGAKDGFIGTVYHNRCVDVGVGPTQSP